MAEEVFADHDFMNQDASVGLLSSSETTDWVEKGGIGADQSRATHPHERAVTIALWLWDGVLFLLPSFVAKLLVRAQYEELPQAKKPRPTAYLDGLRGVAAWIVVNDHLIHVLSKSFAVGFGFDEQHHDFWKLPILRLFYDGTFSVSLFFVISGYALSISPILAMRKVPRDTESAMKRLASSIFRRPIRLLIPCWAATFLAFFLIRVGFFEIFLAREEEFHTYYDGWGKIAEDWEPRMPSLLNQTADLLRNDAHLLWVFSGWHDHIWMTRYDLPLWTIPLEFRASLILFLTHAGLFFMRKWTRITLAMSFIAAGVWLEAFDFPLLWAGYVIAELSRLFGHGKEEKQPQLVTIGCTILVFCGLYVASWPNWGGANTPGYGWMVHLTPWADEISGRWWTGLGSTLLVFCLDRLPARRFFSTKPIAYLGRISFSMYLTHYLIEQTIGIALFHYTRAMLGTNSMAMAVIGFLLGYSITVAIIIWVADVFMRSVDIPAKLLASKAEQWFFLES